MLGCGPSHGAQCCISGEQNAGLSCQEKQLCYTAKHGFSLEVKSPKLTAVSVAHGHYASPQPWACGQRVLRPCNPGRIISNRAPEQHIISSHAPALMWPQPRGGNHGPCPRPVLMQIVHADKPTRTQLNIADALRTPQTFGIAADRHIIYRR